MLNLIVVSIIFRALWSTDCYAQLVWDHLSRVETTFPQDGKGLEPTTKYQVIPGSKGMFLDVAEEIRSRMEGIAKDRFIVVFDFGGVSPKYFSIIEELTDDASVSARTDVVKQKNIARGILEDVGTAPNFSTVEELSEAFTVGMTARPPINQPVVTTGDVLVREDATASRVTQKGNSTIEEPTLTPVDEIVVPINEDAVAKLMANTTPGYASAPGEAPEIIEIVTTPAGELTDASPTPYMSNETVSNSENQGNMSLNSEEFETSDTGIELLQQPIVHQSGDHISVTDQLTNETVNFITLKKPLRPADAIALTTSLKSSTDEIKLIIKKMSFNCVPFKSKKLDVNVFIVDSIVLGEGTICGLDTMKPSNNVTVTNDESTIEVTIPLIFKDLTVKSKSIDVKKFFISVVTGLPIEASVKEIIYKGNFIFEKGTPLKLKDVRLKWEHITGIHLKTLENQGLMSSILDYIGEALSGAVISFVSPIFGEIEKELRNTLLGSSLVMSYS